MFMEVADMGVRAELLNEFPDGCLVVIAGEALIFARQESMDDHCTLIQAFPGSGMNRPSLVLQAAERAEAGEQLDRPAERLFHPLRAAEMV